MRLEAGDPANVSRLDCDVHIGTHVDAPRHFIKNGNTVEQLSLDALIGPAVVAYLPEADAVTADDLVGLDLPGDTERLLLRTRNSELWTASVTEFRKDYVGLTPEAARWIVDQQICLVGIDYLGIHRFGDGPLVHQILLGAGVVIVEGLNLADVHPGAHKLICLPLKLVGAEAAPARAVLQPISAVSGQPPAIGGDS